MKTGPFSKNHKNYPILSYLPEYFSIERHLCILEGCAIDSHLASLSILKKNHEFGNP